MKRAPPLPVRPMNRRPHKHAKPASKFRNHQRVYITMDARLFPQHAGKFLEATVLFIVYDCKGYVCRITEYDEKFVGSYVICPEKYVYGMDHITQVDHYKRNDRVLFRSEKYILCPGFVVDIPEEGDDAYTIQYREWDSRAERNRNKRIRLSLDQIYWIR